MTQLPARLDEHPTVKKVRSRARSRPDAVVDADWLRGICLEAGVDDVGFASVDNPDLASEREHVDAALPGARSFISLVVRMNRDNVRSTARSVANQEFHRSGEIINEAAHQIVRRLQDARHRALNPSATFPIEMDNFPGRIWVVAHKPVAVAAGMGVMGIHRNVIHPKFGNFILLATILLDAPISRYSEPLDYSPCLECKLCVAACAIGKDGSFDFVACSVHNYREFMGGFPTGRRPLPTARTPRTSARASAIPRTHRCGRACRSRPTTRPPTVWRSAPPVRTSSSRTSTTARRSWIWCSSRCRTSAKRSTSYRIRVRSPTPSGATRTRR
jgi:hypothetical protein